jgi:acyl-CoA synthetase (AMP-forming)/AMP-acid ligase II
MPFYDEFTSIPHLAQSMAERWGGETYIIEDEREWSFAETAERMMDVARGLVAIGVKPGDRVALCAPNSAVWIHAALGVHAAGAILVPLSTRFKPVELAHILATSGTSIVITVGEFLGTDYAGRLRESIQRAGVPAQLVAIDGPVRSGEWSLDDLAERGRVVERAEVQARIDALTPEALSDIMFTSGTTGAAKGVKIKHGQSIRGYGWLSRSFSYRERETFAVVPPFFHGFGYKAGWLAGLINALRIIPVPVFEPEKLLELVQSHRVNLLNGPPTIFADLMQHPRLRDYDISSLRVGTTGAATIPLQVITDMHDILGLDVVINAYGLTESTALVSSSNPSDPPERVAHTVGRPAEGLEVRIVDPDGDELPRGETGEIWVRGYLVTEGYWEDPEATAAAITSDGFLRTGDLGDMDAEGYLRVTDRKKDMYIVGGFNAYPAEIEDILIRHPDIAHVAVIGVPDDRMGEVGWAFVVRSAGSHLTEQDVIEYAARTLANFKVPRRVEFLDELPRTPSMKVTKVPLREAALAALGRG